MNFTWIANKMKSIRSKFGTSKRMFSIGDRIKYPHHGTGVITGIQSLKGQGDFFRIQMDNVDMRILVPLDKMSKVGAVYLKPKG